MFTSVSTRSCGLMSHSASASSPSSATVTSQPRLSSWPRSVTDRKSTRLNSSHSQISYAVFCLKKKSVVRSEEHTSELQSQSNIVCRLLLEKKKKHLSTSKTFIGRTHENRHSHSRVSKTLADS